MPPLQLMWADEAWDDYTDIAERDRRTLKRINALIKEIRRTPFEGVGNLNL